jgi:hypothetical protein
VSRPHLERKVRGRVLALPNLTLLQSHDGEEPLFDSRTRRITGLRVRQCSTEATATLDADLFVDARGRGSPSPRWLASWGYGEVAETSVPIEVGYATGVFERRPGDLYGSMGAIIAGTAPQSTRLARSSVLKAIDGSSPLPGACGTIRLQTLTNGKSSRAPFPRLTCST